MNEPEWVDPSVVESFHYEQIREHGGLHGIRDQGMLESALGRPQQLYAYGTPDLCAMAAAYAFGLAKNHPYLDGNKRTAAITCELFLILNGMEFNVDEVAKYPYYLALASGEHTEESCATWLRTVTSKS
ncbi:MAG: type II toxin-antitoxin system death-on-curing family toxin [Akkermansiaceae bacterium]|jgi:death-on-curing protein|tara:strand:- start:258 stop:644 length:387 start_codon:yes stop_codon:yes gene_type:complete